MKLHKKAFAVTENFIPIVFKNQNKPSFPLGLIKNSTTQLLEFACNV